MKFAPPFLPEDLDNEPAGHAARTFLASPEMHSPAPAFIQPPPLLLALPGAATVAAPLSLSLPLSSGFFACADADAAVSRIRAPAAPPANASIRRFIAN